MSKINYVNERIKKIKRMMNDFTDQELNIFQKTKIIFDLGLSIIIYGSGINDYFQYQFYKRKHIDRKTFIVHRKRMKIVNTFNDQEDRKILDSKPAFNKKYSSFINRDWLEISTASLEEFSNFAEKHQRFIVKPADGSHGKGIRIEDISKCNSLEAKFNELKEESPIIEELIVQHNELAEFNPTSVNTLRVVTLLSANGNPKVMTANLRVGNGNKFADNFHHDGIAALIDIDSGIVVTSGIDINFNRYFVHPHSGKQIIGFKIPYWEKVVQTTLKAAKVTPTVGYIGWDVSIDKNGEIIIIEGNAAADPDISQMPDQIGKWPLYKKEL